MRRRILVQSSTGSLRSITHPAELQLVFLHLSFHAGKCVHLFRRAYITSQFFYLIFSHYWLTAEPQHGYLPPHESSSTIYSPQPGICFAMWSICQLAKHSLSTSAKTNLFLQSYRLQFQFKCISILQEYFFRKY